MCYSGYKNLGLPALLRKDETFGLALSYYSECLDCGLFLTRFQIAIANRQSSVNTTIKQESEGDLGIRNLALYSQTSRRGHIWT